MSNRKILSAVMCLSLMGGIILGTTGCDSFKDDSADKVLDVSESFCKAVCDRKTKNAAKCVSDEDSSEVFTTYFEPTDDINSFVTEAIAGTLEFELDEDSVEADKKSGKGSVDAVFSFVDYESVSESEEFGSEEQLIEALEASDEKTEIEVTLELKNEKIDGEKVWVIDNYEDVLEDVFVFKDFEPEYQLDWSILVEDYGFVEPLEDLYFLSFYIFFNSSAYGNQWTGTYSIYYNDEFVFSDCCVLSADDDDSTVVIDYIPYEEEVLTEDGLLMPGDYSIEIYGEDGYLFISDSCYVYYNAPETETTVETTAETTDENVTTVADAAYNCELNGALFGANFPGVEDAFFERVDVSGNDTDSKVAEELDRMLFVVYTDSDEYELTADLYYLPDPSAPSSEFSNIAQQLTVDEPMMSEWNDHDGSYVYWIVVYDLEPGVYFITVDSPDAEYDDNGISVCAYAIELT